MTKYTDIYNIFYSLIEKDEDFFNYYEVPMSEANIRVSFVMSDTLFFCLHTAFRVDKRCVMCYNDVNKS